MLQSIVKILVASIMLLSLSCCRESGKPENPVAFLKDIRPEPLKGWPDPAKFSDTLDGKPVSLFYLRNAGGTRAVLTNYGARMVGLWTPDSSGRMTDVVAGFGSIDEYVRSEERYYGAIVGRYGNRIAGATFKLDGKAYTLDANNGPNSLHGGRTGIHSRVWNGMQVDTQTVIFTYRSPDGEEGYPGNLDVKVIYSLTDADELVLKYEIGTDKKTVVNITNHNFWNLNGEGSGTINNHVLMIAASRYTPVDSTLIPVGITKVAGTPFDFTRPERIGARVEVKDTQLAYGKGYDHNFILDSTNAPTPRLAARIRGNLSGISMEIRTTEPAIQFYGGNFMNGKHPFKSGAVDDHRTAFCLETQHYPDSPNQPAFPSTVLLPGKKYVSTTIHRFSR
jgi:aldose 1-epimerase